MDRILVDGDVCVYAVANASDSHARKECAEQGVEFTPEPFSHVLHSLKLHIESIIEGYHDYVVYLSSLDRADNFRYGRYPKYKDKRPKDKPVHFLAAREYLQTYYNAQVAVGEADDALALAGHAAWLEAQRQARFFGDEDYPFHYLTTVIATVDKDLRMVPGKHYNWKKSNEGIVEVTEAQGWRCFMHQLLTGDAVDSIPGLVRVGPVNADKILAERYGPAEQLAAVVQAYADKGESLSNMRRNADLLWMQVDKRFGSEVLAAVLPEEQQAGLWKAAADAKLAPKPKRGKK